MNGPTSLDSQFQTPDNTNDDTAKSHFVTDLIILQPLLSPHLPLSCNFATTFCLSIRHRSLSTVTTNCSRSQSLQTDSDSWPVNAWYLPGPQSLQVATPIWSLNLPPLQSIQDEIPLLCVPIGHIAWHFAAPAILNVASPPKSASALALAAAAWAASAASAIARTSTA